MKTLEALHLRSVSTEPAEICRQILASLTGLAPDIHTFAVYRRVNLGTDLVIHFLRDSDADGPRKSDMALHLARSLRHFGMVEHTVWEELNPEEDLHREK